MNKRKKANIFAFGDPHLPILEYHNRYGVPLNYYEILQNQLNEANPDLLLIAGDLSWNTKFEEVEKDLNLLKQLSGKKKVFIEGNHDQWFFNLGSTYLECQQKAYQMFSTEDFYYIGGRGLILELGNGNKIGICGALGWENPINFSEVYNSNDQISSQGQKIQIQNLQKSLNHLAQLNRRKQPNTNICLLHYPPINFMERKDKIIEKVNHPMIQIFSKHDFLKMVVYGHVHLEKQHPVNTKRAKRDLIQVVLSKNQYKAIELPF